MSEGLGPRRGQGPAREVLGPATFFLAAPFFPPGDIFAPRPCPPPLARSALVSDSGFQERVGTNVALPWARGRNTDFWRRATSFARGAFPVRRFSSAPPSAVPSSPPPPLPVAALDVLLVTWQVAWPALFGFSPSISFRAPSRRLLRARLSNSFFFCPFRQVSPQLVPNWPTLHCRARKPPVQVLALVPLDPTLSDRKLVLDARA